jgi:RimJ/RimL family protein N-acetyltransferase
MAFLSPLTLAGRHARLEPLTRAHAPALAQAAADGGLHELWFTSVPAPGQEGAYVEAALAAQASGEALPFAVRDLASGEIVGSTRYCHADAANRRLEIGYTWYAARVQRTALNTECKYLLLRHAFEALDCIAVELRTHWLNHRSREAIARLGAKQDGVLRNHQRMPDGSLRDTVVFSIVAAEWPAVKQHLSFKLRQDSST